MFYEDATVFVPADEDDALGEVVPEGGPEDEEPEADQPKAKRGLPKWLAWLGIGISPVFVVGIFSLMALCCCLAMAVFCVLTGYVQ